jgi:hypothetical protein
MKRDNWTNEEVMNIQEGMKMVEQFSREDDYGFNIGLALFMPGFLIFIAFVCYFCNDSTPPT